jgi:hypothetical protein
MIAMAKKSTDPDDYIDRLQNSGSELTVNDAVRSFAVEILNKVPHACKSSFIFFILLQISNMVSYQIHFVLAKKVTTNKPRELSELEKQNLALKKLNATMKPLDNDTNDDYSSVGPSTKSANVISKTMNVRKRAASSSSDDEEV